ncbi:2-succinyl-5-enolpyruvyl-6-hydroxy-3-cyclohexene-1-carboxylic-acid synthase [Bacillus canaveralius]|uniref:2-succinyl-5-enolpyruvyl-6-hydroxy-3-cyclohexene-1-carboxylate synthase n=1 Tax=Bacillus canaveralius TaxID=1403243 RepID=A0A2N5GPH6_9BACI|nr:2-succinyl-5-enolpyruvyl-6-hydroxy-3-cyclohexene-1-carboxylic-acid synthase [Bacillus canaveralius]PLR84452.1 2-succinyl-5-enolpyruvyl-6-hydroxy-3-cyclohexene-1-carboxylic-acid synthase [Bacillus canaveralius]PLS00546.1 2-succinyl-5-enolpyruvyl-6-hydroxy-3-cyclohexene-1-carboxylic-acid synthase [Bacillus canaveralius]RSK57831.1 2-succinyl-5-enolpyruvyl-6-hydroxy-3-cyclohexene-1-carboxylic-acid synthase [Bacillus canaveralius]
MSHQENLTAYIAAFVGELVTAGVKDVVVSPGSRSTPMALMMAAHPELRLYVHVDERSAAFFALGMAKASHRPTAILCTSGTAAANYYPAIIEANSSRVPLIVLTADRPHELRDVGAPQAIDQIHLYGRHVKWFMEMATPEDSPDMLRYARTVCARAAATALRAPAGPVHLNFPFREPLLPDLLKQNLFEHEERTDKYVGIHSGDLTLSTEKYQEISKHINQFEKGIIVCGPIDNSELTESIIQLAQKLQFPIIADPLSQLRSGKHNKDYIIDTYDTFLRNDEGRQALKPDLILRFGAMPVSKALSGFIKENIAAVQYVIDGGAGWRDPSAAASEMLYCNERDFCRSVAKYASSAKRSRYLKRWVDLNDFTKMSLRKVNDIAELSEGKLFWQLAEFIPDQSVLFVANSMPIRDLDTFFHNSEKSIRIMANRGINGIDGVISTALGAAAVSGPVYLVVGDLTFFHDLNGLLAAKLYSLNIKILLINNDGGGIFSFLPQAAEPEHFELLFGTPIGLDFEHVVRMYHGTFTRVSDWSSFNSAFQRNIEDDGLSVIEIPTARDRNLSEHRELWNDVSQEISGFLKEE